MSKWNISLSINGLDYTNRLLGNVNIEREQSTAAIASFEIAAQGLGLMDLPNFVGKTVLIDYVSGNTSTRKFTGIVDTPSIDVDRKTIHFSCTDNLQYIVKQKYENDTIWD